MNDQYPTPEEMARRTALERPNATRLPARGRGGTRTGQPVRSAALERLAERSGSLVGELLNTIPPDTLRRLKYPVFEQEQGDGTIKFVHPTALVP